MESLFELWGRRNPEWEKRYQNTIMDVFTDYGKGVNQYQDIRGKIFGAGYEIYIIAFFIGLYFDKTRPLVEDRSKRKVLGQAIMYWGNVETRNGRNPYSKIREYIFAALIARTDIDFIALDKGEITPKSVVDNLITKMEQYANFGFRFIEEKLEDDPNYFFNDSAFLRVFTSFLSSETKTNDTEESQDSLDEDPDPLDIPSTEDLQCDESFDEEAMRAEAEKPWDEDDIERLTMYYSSHMELMAIAERLHKSVYAVQFQLSKMGFIRMPLNVEVKNTTDGGTIINQSGDIVYTNGSPLKIFNDKIYRFNLKSMYLTVKEIKREEGKWVKSAALLIASSSTDLYMQLTKSNFIDVIEDFVEGKNLEDNMIKVNGKWYNYFGNSLSLGE